MGKPIQEYPDSIPPVDKEFERIWRLAGYIGQFSSDDHLRSFTSILLAFLIAEDPISTWFRHFVVESSIDAEKLLQARDISGDAIKKIVEMEGRGVAPKGKPQYTQSAKILVEQATRLLYETAATDKTPTELNVRHLMAAYIYGDIGVEHTRQLESWGFKQEVWSQAFLVEMFGLFPDELDSWKNVHQNRFSTEPVLDSKEAERQSKGEQKNPYPVSFDEDVVPIHADRPALPAEDAFGRAAFANSLAQRLNTIWVENNQANVDSAFMVHLHGPWGAGKTTMFNLLEAELLKTKTVSKREQNWQVTRFNAWQNQHIDPPWWSLLDTVYRGVLQSLWKCNKRRAIKIWIKEQSRRLFMGQGQYIVGSVLFIWLLVLLLWVPWDYILQFISGGKIVGDTAATNFSDAVKATSGAFGIIATIWGVSVTLSRTLLRGSAQAARSFVQHSGDPMEQVRKNFHSLIEDVRAPVAIFVDDVDRCDADYVVKILEGIQTLFRDRRVIYVVAADRRWLYSCFEQVYSKFSKSVHDPGRRLGYLFLEKAFQLSASIPRLSDSLRSTYWQKLIKQSATISKDKIKQSKEKAEQLVKSANTQEKAMEALQQHTDDPVFQQAVREAVVMRMAGQDVQESTKHFLRDFSPLLEPNPRSMKRLVNAYGIQLALAILAMIPIEHDVNRRKQLALWTIVSLRWPLLEEALDKSPGLADQIINKMVDMNKVNEEIKPLVENDLVEKVFNGSVVGVSLDTTAVHELASLRSATSTVGAVA